MNFSLVKYFRINSSYVDRSQYTNEMDISTQRGKKELLGKSMNSDILSTLYSLFGLLSYFLKCFM